MNIQILFYTFIAIFGITAVITILGITGVIKTINKRYLNALFSALIIEVIGAVIGVFKSADFTQEGKIPEQIYTQTSLASSGDYHNDLFQIITKLQSAEDYDDVSSKNVALELELDQCISDNNRLNDDLDRLDKNFYVYVIKLRSEMNDLGGSINICYEPEKKKEVYKLLEKILIVLKPELFSADGEDQLVQVRNAWSKFKLAHGRTESSLVLEYDIVMLVRDYLNMTYPMVQNISEPLQAAN